MLALLSRAHCQVWRARYFNAVVSGMVLAFTGDPTTTAQLAPVLLRQCHVRPEAKLLERVLKFLQQWEAEDVGDDIRT